MNEWITSLSPYHHLLYTKKRQWNGDLNEIKGRVKQSIEDMVAQWSEEEKAQCVGATADAFRYGGGINAYLSGGGKASSPH